MSMVYDVIANRTQDGSSHLPQTTTAHDDHVRFLLLGRFCDKVARILCKICEQGFTFNLEIKEW